MPIGKTRAYLSLLGVILLWASTPVVVDKLTDKNAVIVVLAWASIFSAAVLLAGVAATGRFRELRSWSTRDWRTIAGMGLLGIAGYTTFFYIALYLAPPDEAMVVNYLWPIFLVILAGWILGERHDAWIYFGIGLSFVGMIGIVTGWKFESPTPRHLAGYGIATLGALSWALFSVFGKKQRYDKLTAMALYFVVGVLVYLPALFFYSLFWGETILPRPGWWWELIYLGGAVNGIAYVLWFQAVAAGPTAVFANLIFATPFAALILLWVGGRAPLRAGVWLSLALIVAGAIIALNHSTTKAVNELDEQKK